MIAVIHFTTISANLTQPIRDKERHVLEIFSPELAKLCMLELFLERFCTIL